MSSDSRTRTLRPIVRSVLGVEARRVSLALAVMTSVFVGAGCAKKVIVPDVVKQDLDQAQKTLAAVPLKVGNITGPQGAGAYVTQQNPAVGQQVEANSIVALTVDAPVSIPALVGGNITDAVSTLQGLGLRVAFLSKHTLNPFAKTKVEGQNPAPNTLVHHDTVVTLNVSGPADVDALLSVVAKEAAYQKLNPKYKVFLDAFLNNPGVARSMEPEDAPSAPSTPSAPNK
jgi:beta-lactam-binding protein with PASTA domain